jgi:hypothetical protein
LFFVSIIAVYVLFKNLKKSYIKLIFVIWLLAWLAFAIKLTSLLLVLWIIALLFYTELGFAWFLWFLWLFIVLFTKVGLWKYMNISYDKTDLWLINSISISALIISIIFIYIWYIKHKKNIKKLLVLVSIFILWFIVSLSPWLAKNTIQAYPNISVWTLLWWKTESFNFDKTKI